MRIICIDTLCCNHPRFQWHDREIWLPLRLFDWRRRGCTSGGTGIRLSSSSVVPNTTIIECRGSIEIRLLVWPLQCIQNIPLKERKQINRATEFYWYFFASKCLVEGREATREIVGISSYPNPHRTVHVLFITDEESVHVACPQTFMNLSCYCCYLWPGQQYNK
jgi:hypothetical protein